MTNRGLFKGRFTPAGLVEQIPHGTWGPSRQVAGTQSVLQQWGGSAATAGLGTPLVINLPIDNQGPLTESAWTVIAEELPCDMEGIQILAAYFANSAIVYNLYFQFAIGKPGKEKIIIPGLLSSCRDAVVNTMEFIGPVPIKIPAGARVSVRYVSDSSVSTVNFSPKITVIFHRKWPNAGTQAACIPFTQFDAQGRFSTGGVANAENSWTDIGISPFYAKWVIPSIGLYSQLNSTTLLVDWSYLDSSGNNVIFLENIPVHTNANENMTMGSSIPIPCSIPSGARLQTRRQAGTVAISIMSLQTLLLIGD